MRTHALLVTIIAAWALAACNALPHSTAMDTAAWQQWLHKAPMP